MDKVPANRPAVRRVDEASADMGTLVDMGVVDEQPEPEPPEPPAEPPVDEPTPTETANLMMLDAALVESGVTKTDADTAAVSQLAKMDTATVETVTRWVKHGKKTGTK